MPKKNPDGTGTYYKETRGSRTLFCWKLRLQDAPKPIVIKRATDALRKDAVKAKLQEIEEKGYLLAEDDKNVRQALTQWLEEKVRPNKRPATYRDYKRSCETLIFPSIGHVKMSKLSAATAQKMVAYGQLHKFSNRDIRQAATTLYAALPNRRAQDIKEDVELPPAPKPRDRVLSMEEMEEFMAELFREIPLKTRPGEVRHAYRDRFLVTFLLDAGPRINEALGLLIMYANPKTAKVSIVFQLVREEDEATKKQVWELGPLKGTHSEREIPLSPTGILALEGQLAMLAVEKERAGGAYEDNGLLFATERGTPGFERNVNRTVYNVIDAVNARRREEGRLEMKKASVHDLRRSCLTWLAEAGETVKRLMGAAGHGSIATTFKHYVWAQKLQSQEARPIDFIAKSKAKAVEEQTQEKEAK